MKVYTTVPVENPAEAGTLFHHLERIGYDGAFSYETKHDPFLPLAVASLHTEKIALGTAIAIAFARNPMTLANIGYDLQVASQGRFILGLGSQIRPHIVNRYSSVWSRPAARMREMVLAIRAIWDAWEGSSKLCFEGEFYRHTLMTPAFDPGPNPFGPPRIFVAGVQPRMTEVAGEVADGFVAHPFATRKSLEEVVIPALARGREKSGHRHAGFEIMCVTLLATGETPEEIDANKEVVRKQLAFYGSTPAYRPTLDCHGWGELQPELNAMSKQGRWDDMAGRITDEILESIAVVAPRRDAAAAITQRLAGLADSVSIENTRAPDPSNFADIVADLKRGAES
ncbi:MAG: TIGR03617 family F420-dependent LLM class oxidoreductase [Myxococcales bacterium]|nr:MAG: TIGR03617 family F420-dependent LLM class oxidoreductase [Myxococcales bacterium]